MIHDSYLRDFVLADRQAKILINFILSMNIFNGNVLIGEQLDVVKTGFKRLAPLQTAAC